MEAEEKQIAQFEADIKFLCEAAKMAQFSDLPKWLSEPLYRVLDILEEDE